VRNGCKEGKGKRVILQSLGGRGETRNGAKDGGEQIGFEASNDPKSKDANGVGLADKIGGEEVAITFL